MSKFRLNASQQWQSDSLHHDLLIWSDKLTDATVRKKLYNIWQECPSHVKQYTFEEWLGEFIINRHFKGYFETVQNRVLLVVTAIRTQDALTLLADAKFEV